MRESVMKGGEAWGNVVEEKRWEIDLGGEDSVLGRPCELLEPADDDDDDDEHMYCTSPHLTYFMNAN